MHAMPNQHPSLISVRFASFRHLLFLLAGILFLALSHTESRASTGLFDLLDKASDKALEALGNDAPMDNGAPTRDRKKANADAEKRRTEAAHRQAEAIRIAGAPLVLAPDLGVPSDEVSHNPTRRWIRANITAPWLAEIKSRPDAKDYEQDILAFETLLFDYINHSSPTQNHGGLEKRFAGRSKKNPSDVWLAFATRAIPCLLIREKDRYVLFSGVGENDERYKRLREVFEKLTSAISPENAARHFVASHILLTYAPHHGTKYFPKTSNGTIPEKETKLRNWIQQEQDYAMKEFLHSLQVAMKHNLFRTNDGENFLYRSIVFQRSLVHNFNPLAGEAQKFYTVLQNNSEYISEWCRELAIGFVEHKRAWNARGYDYEIKDREGFSRHNRIAYEHYKRADKLNPKNPIAAADLITIAHETPVAAEESPRYWFDRATFISGNYHPSYYHYAISLRDDWDVSIAEWQALIKACAAKDIPDSFDRISIIHSIMNIKIDDWDTTSTAMKILQGENTASKIAECFNHFAAKEKNEKHRAYLYSSAGILAWISADYKSARTAFEGNDWKIGANIFDTNTTFSEYGIADLIWTLRYLHAPRIIGEAAVLTEPGAESYKNGKDLFYSKLNYEKAVELFADAAKKSTSEHARNWAETMRVTANAAAQFEKAQSVDLTAQEYHRAWLTAEPASVQIIPGEKPRIKVQTKDSGYENAWFMPLIPLPAENYEIIAKIKPLDNFRAKAYIALLVRCNAAVKWHAAPVNSEVFARANWNGKKIEYTTTELIMHKAPDPFNGGVMREFPAIHHDTKQLPATEIIELRTEVRDGKGRAWVNGGVANSGSKMEHRCPRDIPVLLFASWEKPREFEIVEYTVRKLPEKPKAAK